MKHKVSELEGALLDFAVRAAMKGSNSVVSTEGVAWPYSNSWAHAGPIIERERIKLLPPQADRSRWLAETWQDKPHFGWAEADTPLIAAMRAYVASKLGEEIELP